MGAHNQESLMFDLVYAHHLIHNIKTALKSSAPSAHTSIIFKDNVFFSLPDR